jgi:glycosyltransferase involved in cell wall biosynthesis
MNDAPIISIIVCTYNREKCLELALNSLITQTAEKNLFEVIIIDSNSSDSTFQLCNRIISKNSNFYYFNCPEKGLSNARNYGLKYGRGIYIGYIDDDAIAPPHWIQTALDIIEQERPDVFGGPYYPYYTFQKPKWFKDKYGSFSLSEKSGYLSAGNYLIGANIFFLKEILLNIGGFNSKLGMKGDLLGYGEETQVQKLIYNKKSHKIFYSIDLYVYHIVRRQKMNFLWLIKSYFANGKDSSLIFLENPKFKKFIYKEFLISIFLIFFKFCCFYVSLFKGLLLRKRSEYPNFKNYFYEKSLKYIGEIGFSFGKLKLFMLKNK